MASALPRCTWLPSRGNHRAGFTFIELVVVSGLTIVLMGGALASMGIFSNQKSRSEGGQMVISTLRRAQNRARSGDKPATCGTLNGYRVWGNAGSNEYRMALRCDGVATDLETQVYSLPNFETFRGAFSVMYLPQPGQVTGVPVTIQVGTTESYYEFSVLNNGVITEGQLVEQ